jgi:hypothetical protein
VLSGRSTDVEEEPSAFIIRVDDETSVQVSDHTASPALRNTISS